MAPKPKNKAKAATKKAATKQLDHAAGKGPSGEYNSDWVDEDLADDERDEDENSQSKTKPARSKVTTKKKSKAKGKASSKKKAPSKEKPKQEDENLDPGINEAKKKNEPPLKKLSVASREKIQAKNIVLNELKATMREEKVLALKRKHDLEMKTMMWKELAEKEVDNEVCPEIVGESSAEMELVNMVHPDDVIMLNPMSDSEVSEISEGDIKGSSSGAYVELDDLDENLYISTWTFVLTAAHYQSNPVWQHVDKNNKVHFYKDECHASFRTTLKKFIRRMSPLYKWEYEDLLTAVFEENPDLIDASDLKEHCRRDKWNLQGGRLHAHIICQYDGNQRRGCLIKVVKKMRDFFAEKGWKMHASTIYNRHKPRPLHDSREKQHSYLMCTMNQKEVVDLEPSTSRAWHPMPTVDARQWRDLRIQMGKPAERDVVLSHLRSLKTLPSNPDEYITMLRKEVRKHAELYEHDRTEWRKQYYKFLPLRQIKKYIEGCLRQRGAFKQLIDSVAVEAVNVTADWGYKEFWQRSLGMKCVCGNNIDDDVCPESKKMHFTVPKVSDEDVTELLQGRTSQTVRSFVLTQSNYRIFKLMLKHKCFKEPEQDIIYRMGRHLYLLTSSSIPTIGRRLQNMHWASLVGDSGKSALMSMLMAVYGCLGEDSKDHLVLTITPEAFGSHGASTYSLYKAVRINEVTPGTLTGGLMRLLMEGDHNARMPTKGDSVKITSSKTRQHAIVWMTSNLPTKEEFMKVCKDMGLQCRWTGSDYDRNFSSNGGRVGAEFRTEVKIPPILKREIFDCSKCGALLVRWLVRRYILSPYASIRIPMQNIWVDSDAEEDFSGVTEKTPFWKVVGLDPNEIEEKQNKMFQAEVQQGKQTYSMDAREAHLFAKFKEELREKEERAIAERLQNSKSENGCLESSLDANDVAFKGDAKSSPSTDESK